MGSLTTERNFFDLFNNDFALLKVKFNVNSDELPTDVHIKNLPGKKTGTKDLKKLAMMCTDHKTADFVEFYSRHNGFELATVVHPVNALKKTLLRQLPASDLGKFTKQYLPGGKLAWTIDLNKAKALYRGEHKWLAFAEVDGGPACLTIFLDGENAGNVFLLNPQPHFNILKPIAKSYSLLLERIAKDPAAFFRLIRAYVTIERDDKQRYGYVPVEYEF
jgi:hypothetical protein